MESERVEFPMGEFYGWITPIDYGPRRRKEDGLLTEGKPSGLGIRYVWFVKTRRAPEK